MHKSMSPNGEEDKLKSVYTVHHETVDHYIQATNSRMRIWMNADDLNPAR